MTGETVHTISKEKDGTRIISVFLSECMPQLSITKVALWFAFSYVQPVHSITNEEQ